MNEDRDRNTTTANMSAASKKKAMKVNSFTFSAAASHPLSASIPRQHLSITK